jgi:uncharacterized protein
MIIADSGFWVALGNRNDKYHSQAISTLSKINESLITTYPVITEVCHLLLKRGGAEAMLNFMKNHYQQEYLEIFQLELSHKRRIFELMQKYIDLPMDFADASLVLLAEELGHGRILSTDKRDFQTYRWKNHHPFENLLTQSS